MVESKKIWMDGKLVEWGKANIHVMTHALHYGLGVFEGVRCYATEGGGGAVFRLREHTDRLFASAHIVMLDIPFTREEINNATIETLKANGLTEGLYKADSLSRRRQHGLLRRIIRLS